MKLQKPHVNSLCRSSFFSVRVLNGWNSLLQHVIDAISSRTCWPDIFGASLSESHTSERAVSYRPSHGNLRSNTKNCSLHG